VGRLVFCELPQATVVFVDGASMLVRGSLFYIDEGLKLVS